MPRAIFFDAAGTLIRLTKSVGEHYALVGRRRGIELDPAALSQVFAEQWRQMPARPATGQARPDDDKGWWRELVRRILAQARPGIDPLDFDNFFEAAYSHFAEPGVWELYPEVPEVLSALAPCFELSVVSNFDGRLLMVLEHLGVLKLFRHVFVSSELGADKPDPEIFRRALAIAGFRAEEVLHVGDDPERDWQAARSAGLEIFALERPQNSLRDLLARVAPAGDSS